MSKKNSDAKATARERMAAERQKELAAAKRKRAFTIGGSVIAVLAVAAGVGIFVGTQSSKDDDKAASGVKEQGKQQLVYPKAAYGAEGTVLIDGKPDAPAVLTVFEDFRCPICSKAEQAFGGTMRKMVDEGKIRVEYHIMNFIDDNMKGSGSHRAANAVACSSDSGKFREYHELLFKNQPEETSDKFAQDSYLLELAGQVDGLKTPAFEQCVSNGTYMPWVKKTGAEFNKVIVGGKKVNGTPTFAVNNLLLDLNGVSTGDDFQKKIEGLIANSPKAEPAKPFTAPPAPGQPTPVAS
jgi:protein-disulfide isomerase